MRNNIYKLLWFLTPIIFLFFYFLKGSFCIMYSCTGNDDVGLSYGFGAVIVYALVLKLSKREGLDRRFVYILTILCILFAYFLGKANGLGV